MELKDSKFKLAPSDCTNHILRFCIHLFSQRIILCIIICTLRALLMAPASWCLCPFYAVPLSVGQACDLLLTNTTGQRWAVVRDYVSRNMHATWCHSTHLAEVFLSSCWWRNKLPHCGLPGLGALMTLSWEWPLRKEGSLSSAPRKKRSPLFTAIRNWVPFPVESQMILWHQPADTLIISPGRPQ